MVASFFLHNKQSLTLLGAILIGSSIGYFFQDKAVFFKPAGDVFLHLLFTLVVPLIFFSVASSLANKGSAGRIKSIVWNMGAVFVFLSVSAVSVMALAVQFFPAVKEISLPLQAAQQVQHSSVGDLLVRTATVSDFFELLSKKNLLPLIIFSLLVGFAVSALGETAKAMKQFLAAGEAVSIKIVSYIMLLAPVGLGSYFAYLVGTMGVGLLGSYVKAVSFYFLIAFLYFFIGNSIYAFIAGSWEGVKRFWSHIAPPALTAFATGSSVASIPSNLEASRQMGVPADIREFMIPLATALHKQGSCLAALLKISLLFGLFDLQFSGFSTVGSAMIVAILCGTVMGCIPSGGFIGEMLIIDLYGFPPETLPIIAMLGALVDAPATMVNATGANMATLLVARRMEGKKWLDQSKKLASV